VRRYLETLFRRRDIFFVPIIVTPLIALGVLALGGTQQEVRATLWVEPSPFFPVAETPATRELTANQREAQTLRQSLSTRSFRQAVLEESGLAERVRAGQWPRLSGVQQFSRSAGLDSVPLLSGVLRAFGLAGPATINDAMSMAEGMLRRRSRSLSVGCNTSS
jgi:hypothetical protein